MTIGEHPDSSLGGRRAGGNEGGPRRSSARPVRRARDNADRITSTRLAYVEAATDIAQAERDRSDLCGDRRDALMLLDELWPVADVIELGGALMREGGEDLAPGVRQA